MKKNFTTNEKFIEIDGKDKTYSSKDSYYRNKSSQTYAKRYR